MFIWAILETITSLNWIFSSFYSFFQSNFFSIFWKFFHFFRPRCDSCGHFCDNHWFQLKLPTIQTGSPEMPYVKESNEVIICKHCFAKGLIPEIFDPSSFEKISFLTMLENANKNSKNQKFSKFQNLNFLVNFNHFSILRAIHNPKLIPKSSKTPLTS